MTIKEASLLWGITERRVNELCKSGRIPGAAKSGRQWHIPEHAQKPVDKRTRLSKNESEVLPLPVGISDYRKASSEYYYVDKTLLIRDFLDERPQVSLFTRPRRFGKTLNMDMLRTFFEKTSEDTSVYFRDKKIWAAGEKYQRYQGKYPVIYVTFKDVKCQTYEATYDLIAKILRSEFERHSELLDSERISRFEKNDLLRILNGNADENDISMSLLNLSRMLHLHHGIAPIIIIDEYDTPIQQGYMRGFYEPIIDFMRNLFSGGLKDNPHLSYGFLTGILRVAKESIFSGLNNLKINSILDYRYSQYFGFTSDEVREMADYYGVSGKYQEICDWYDGYRFGKTDIFNPWSVINYFSNDCRPKTFWQSTGSNDIIHEVLSAATPDILEHLEALMEGKSFLTHIDTGVIYPQLQNNPASVYSFLLVTGYLKAQSCDNSYSGDYMCEVALPNREISFVYSKEILSRYESFIPRGAVTGIQEALYRMDIDGLQKKLETFLLETISFHDTSGEAFYHGLILGLCAMMTERYRVSSNRESGNGRFDIRMFPLDSRLPGILIELKAAKDCSESRLNELAENALCQINERMYDMDFKASGIQSVLKYGIAFSGKKVSVRAEMSLPS